MARMPRVKGEYSVYHVIQRGNERREIFRDDEDKIRFLETLQRMKEKYSFGVYGYCMMDNHIHMIVDTRGNDISQVMKSINVSYVIYFNRKYSRVGHLFQDRFKSEVVGDDRYLLELSRYIHRNPVKAGLAKTAGEYKWSSYNIYTGKARDLYHLVDTSKILKQLSPDTATAVKMYIEYVNRIEDREDWQPEITASVEVVLENGPERPAMHLLTKKEDILNLVRAVAEEHGVAVADLFNKGTPHIQIRNAAIKIVRQNTNLTLAEIGAMFGGLTYSTVSKILCSGS